MEIHLLYISSEAARALYSVGGALLGVLVTLYIKDKARDVLHSELGNYLAKFQLDLIEKLDEKYKLSREYQIQYTDLDERIEALEERMGMIDSIASDTSEIKRSLAFVREQYVKGRPKQS